jgi:hypothetical protein
MAGTKSKSNTGESIIHTPYIQKAEDAPRLKQLIEQAENRSVNEQ